jgi:DNA polymerase-3 subunit delta'
MISEENFLGNSKIVRYLNKALQKGFISHAYLLEGPEHVGKATLALLFASELLEERPEEVRKNPDLLYVSPEGEDQISVDAIRQLQKDLSLYPYRSRYKVAIIDGAERMNRTAANSLLKTLEEPGQTTVLILVSSSGDKLLDTIRSRCQAFSLNTARRTVLEAHLSRLGHAQADTVARMAEGRPGVAIALAQDEEAVRSLREARSEILDIFAADDYQRMERAGRLAGLEKEEAVQVLDCWTAALREEIIRSLEKGEMERTRKVRLALDRIASVKEDIRSNNVNLKLALENLCLSF